MTKKEKILKFMQEKEYIPLLFDELITVLDVPKEDRQKFEAILQELVKDGKVVKTKKGRFTACEQLGYILGTYQGNEKGFGFLIPEDTDLSDYFIPENATGCALHGDTVLVRKTNSSERRTEAEVIKVIRHANQFVVGTFEKSRNFGFVVPDEKHISRDLFVSKSDQKNAKDGDKVVAKILNYGENRRNPECEIVEVLGNVSSVGVDILSIIRRYHLTSEFPFDVIKQVKNIPDHVLEEDLKGRLDLRDKLIFTIDGDDARDFDDAVSLDKLENGLYRLGVHIADVTHYVREKSALDKEAFKRGTSVYFVDRVIPMLPFELSNGICSLNPHVDRLTFSVFMDVDKNGKVQDYDIQKSVINSKERMTYNNVTAFLEKSDPEILKRYDYMKETLYDMRDLAEILRNAKTARGNIDFNFDECKLILDDTGKPIEIMRYVTGVSNSIIEEFMLLCNETVAKHVSAMQLPFVYRVHEEPDREKIHAFMELVSNLGYHPKSTVDLKPKVLQGILEECRGSKEEKIISTIMLRSLKKAIYSDEDLGHFGLALKSYCHFTSPIRRYPDLAIHRILYDIISGNLTDKKIRHYKKFAKEAAKQSSDCEMNAAEAEREVEDLKKVEFMQDHVGEVYDGIISSVMSFGFFVELENTVEGLIRVANLEDDYYNYDEKHYCLVGEHTKRVFKIGDPVRVKLIKADLVLKQIDFALYEE